MNAYVIFAIVFAISLVGRISMVRHRRRILEETDNNIVDE